MARGNFDYGLLSAQRANDGGVITAHSGRNDIIVRKVNPDGSIYQWTGNIRSVDHGDGEWKPTYIPPTTEKAQAVRDTYDVQ